MPMKREVTVADHDPCPCGSQLIFVDCCAPYLRREALPAYAEQLMRSRYSAFVLHDAAYLRDTPGLSSSSSSSRSSMVSWMTAWIWLGCTVRTFLVAHALARAANGVAVVVQQGRIWRIVSTSSRW
jgi:uncharacterized protein YchJ